MLTLGIDLASQPKKTGTATIDWTTTGAVLEQLHVGADDDAIVSLAEKSNAVGIDSPFGWPVGFVELAAGGAPSTWSNSTRDTLRFRRTDFAVRSVLGRWPLSVSSDLIGVPAMRCRSCSVDSR